jgi:translation initiation factor 4A
MSDTKQDVGIEESVNSININNKQNYKANTTNKSSSVASNDKIQFHNNNNQYDNRQNNRQNNRNYQNNTNNNNRTNNRHHNQYDNNQNQNQSQNNQYDNTQNSRQNNNNQYNRQNNRNYQNNTQYDNTQDNRQDNRNNIRNTNNNYDNRTNNRQNNRNNNYRSNRQNNEANGNTNNTTYNTTYNEDEEDQEQQNQQFKKQSSTSTPTPDNQIVEDINAMTPENIVKRENCMIPLETFDDLAELIDLKIIRGVIAYGFENPSPIQQKAIKPFLSKFDLIAQAQSGTGKTATFCIGTLGRLDFSKNELQAIVLAHTLELAQQIEHVFTNIGKYTDLRLTSAVKTTTVRENIDLLLGRNHPEALIPHVVIGTPGRILDMIMKGAIDVDTLRVLVLDEADELLSEGFIVQIKQIISAITDKTQIGLFSATMDSNFFKLTEKFLRNPINILIKKENLTLEGIKQFYIDCEKNDFKFETLCDLYSLFSTCQTIIYCNYHQSVEILAKKMQEQDFKVSYIHGSMNIADREDAMKKFRNLTTRVLISTDLLGRGIDVQQVSIVINYDIPFKSEAYIHRIGRSGRHGRTGTAINFTTNNDIKRMNDIEKYYETRILPLPVDMASVFQSNF